jgi:predicted DNA-binding transcriptional regulator AlpA
MQICLNEANNETKKGTQEERMNQRLISEKQVAEQLGLPKSLIRKLRVEKKIPHFDLGYRTVMYNLPDVLAAMKRLEVRPLV